MVHSAKNANQRKGELLASGEISDDENDVEFRETKPFKMATNSFTKVKESQHQKESKKEKVV